MKKTTQLLSLALVLAMLIAIAVIPAAAETFAYTAIPGTTTTFTSKISGSPTPAWTTTYAVGAGTAVMTENGYESIHAGPTPANVTLTNNSTTPSAGTVTFVAGGTNEFTVTVDFTGVSFDEPGVYRYTLTQSRELAPGMSLASVTERTLDVWVHDNNGTLQIAGYVIQAGSTKDPVFENKFDSRDLTVAKTVSGNQASHDKFFKFTITITGLEADTAYEIDLTNASATTGTNAATAAANRGQTNPTSATGTQFAAGVTVYLQHNQNIKVKSLPVGATYTVAEEKEDYTNTPPENASGTVGAENITVTFENTKAGDVPTGVILAVVPGAALLAAGIVGFIVMSRKKKDEEEE